MRLYPPARRPGSCHAFGAVGVAAAARPALRFESLGVPVRELLERFSYRVPSRHRPLPSSLPWPCSPVPRTSVQPWIAAAPAGCSRNVTARGGRYPPVFRRAHVRPDVGSCVSQPVQHLLEVLDQALAYCVRVGGDCRAPLPVHDAFPPFLVVEGGGASARRACSLGTSVSCRRPASSVTCAV